MTGKQAIGLAFVVLTTLMVGIYFGTKEGIKIGRAQLEPQIQANKNSIAILGEKVSQANARYDQAEKLLTFIGLTTWYGDKEHGWMQASGVRFNRYKLTAASKFLPFGSKWFVTNLENGRQVALEIMDNGPNITGRFLDLSEAAARQLQMVRDGVVWTRITPMLGD